MTATRRAAVGGVAFLVILHCARATGQPAQSVVAIVSGLTGTATVTVPPNRRPSPVRLFDWLAAGSSIEVASGSRLTLIFSNGARYELAEASRVTIGTISLTLRSGAVRDLEAVPPLPRLPPIDVKARAGSQPAAVRIRGATIAHLYPDSRATTLADSTVLRFRPILNAGSYTVDVETERGTIVFHGETPSATLSIPPRILQPATKYFWRVSALDRIGQTARGAADFATLSEETARARATLEASLAAGADAASLALLAEIDRSLGLLVEAREKLRAAVAKAPGDTDLRQALDRLDEQLAVDR